MTYSVNKSFRAPASLFKPLIDNANAKIFFTESVVVIDQNTGRQRIGKSNTVELEFNAIVHEDENPQSPSDVYSPGKDQKKIEVRGRLTEPTTFPDTIAHLSEGRMEITGNDGVIVRSGKFVLKLLPQDPYVGDSLGTTFWGLFQPD